jgi:peptidoglycan/LPS O-acetylase OafA/YrhL
MESATAYFKQIPPVGLGAYAGRLGAEAVQCFFVLSGFLITYLLLQERSQTGQISVRQFYWKRVLRIWPLYYTITLFGFLVVPGFFDLASYPGMMQSFHQSTWWLYVLILPNVALILYPRVLGASQLWSIGIEEQFYLFWPWVVRACKQHLPWVLLGCIVCKPFLVELVGNGLATLIKRGTFRSQGTINILSYAHLIWKIFPFETLAWGGLFAWLVHSRNQFWPRVIGHPASQVASWTALAAWHLYPVPLLHEWHYQLPIAGLLYGLAIWNIGANPRTLIGLRARWLNKYGALTYGIYMWHMAVLLFVYSAATSLKLPELVPTLLLQIGLCATVIGLTFVVAQLSFTYLEMPFLRMKDRWFNNHAPSIPVLASFTSEQTNRLVKVKQPGKHAA